MPSGDRRPAASWQAQHTGLSIVADAMSRFVAFTDAEVSALQSLESKPDTVIRGDELVAPGQRGGKPFVILEGAVVEFRIDASGRRQALELMLRGEIANLRATILGATDIFMVAASDCVISRFTADEFHRLVATHPRLGTVMVWRAAVGRSMLAEHLLDVGRRSALQRLGHRLLELLVRMEMAGISDGRTLSVPLDLLTLSDMLGLTVEHTSRTLGRLREDGLINTNGGRITVLDRQRLAELSDFDPSYLHTDGFPDSWGNGNAHNRPAAG